MLLFFRGGKPLFSSFLIVFNSSVFFMPNSSLLDEIDTGFFFHLGSLYQYPHGQNWSILMKTSLTYFHGRMVPFHFFFWHVFLHEDLRKKVRLFQCLQSLVPRSLVTSSFVLLCRNLRLSTLQSLPKLQHDMIPTRGEYYILSNKLQLIAHICLNFSKVLFLMLTYFSVSNFVLTLCFRPVISGSMFVLLQSDRYNFAISNK